jgi:hypothetical protein
MHYELCDYQKCQRPAARTWYLTTWKMGEHDCATNGLPFVTKTKLLASLNRLPERKFNCSIRVQTHRVQIYQLSNRYPFMYTNSLPVTKLLKNTEDQDIFVWSYEVPVLCSNGSSCSQLKIQFTEHTHLLVSVRSKSKNQLLVEMQLLMVYCSTLAASTNVCQRIN